MRVCEREAMSGSALKGYVSAFVTCLRGLTKLHIALSRKVVLQPYARMSKCIVGNVIYGPLTFT